MHNQYIAKQLYFYITIYNIKNIKYLRINGTTFLKFSLHTQTHTHTPLLREIKDEVIELVYITLMNWKAQYINITTLLQID